MITWMFQRRLSKQEAGTR